MKFKPGDEIVIVDKGMDEPYENGDNGILREREMFYWRVVIGDKAWLVDEKEMEHAEVVASPLWRALE